MGSFYRRILNFLFTEASKPFSPESLLASFPLLKTPQTTSRETYEDGEDSKVMMVWIDRAVVEKFFKHGKFPFEMSLLGYDNLKDDENEDISMEEQESRNRCFFTCFTIDRMFSVVSGQPISFLPDKSSAEVLRSSPALLMSDADWFSQSLSELRLSDDDSEPEPEESSKNGPSERALQKTSEEFEAIPEMILSARIMTMLYDITNLEKRYGELNDLSGMGVSSDPIKAKEGEERMSMYLEMEARLGDWYESVPHRVRVCSFSDNSPGGITVLEELLQLPPFGVYDATGGKHSLLFHHCMIYVLYSCCQMQLRHSRLHLRRILVQEDISRLTKHELFGSLEPSATLKGSENSPNPRSSLPSPPLSEKEDLPLNPFDYPTSARLRRTFDICMESLRNAIVGEAFMFLATRNQSFLKAHGFNKPVIWQTLLEVYLTTVIAFRFIFPRRAGKPTLTSTGQAWYESVLEQGVEGERMNEDQSELLVDEIVALMELGIPPASLFCNSRKGKDANHNNSSGPAEVLSVFSEIAVLQKCRAKIRKRGRDMSLSISLMQIQRLLGSLRESYPDDFNPTPSQQVAPLAAEIIALGDDEDCPEELWARLEKEEAAQLLRIEKVLECVKVNVPIVRPLVGGEVLKITDLNLLFFLFNEAFSPYKNGPLAPGPGSFFDFQDASSMPMLITPQMTSRTTYEENEDPYDVSTTWMDRAVLEKFYNSGKLLPFEVVRRKTFLDGFEESPPLLRYVRNNLVIHGRAIMSVPAAPLQLILRYCEEARKHIPIAVERPSLESLQGIITMAMVSMMIGRNASVFMQVGMAARMIGLLGFDRLTPKFDENPDFTLDEKETIKRCFLTCFAFDRGALNIARTEQLSDSIRLVLSFVTAKPTLFYSELSQSQIVQSLPKLSMSDADWFHVENESVLTQILSPTSPRPPNPSPCTTANPTPNPTPAMPLSHPASFDELGTFNPDLLPRLHPDTPRSLNPMPSPNSSQHLSPSPQMQAIKIEQKADFETPHLMLAARSISLLCEITKADKKFGPLEDLAGLGFGTDEAKVRIGGERMKAYLGLEADIEDWYEGIPEERKVKAPLGILEGTLKVEDVLIQPHIFFFSKTNDETKNPEDKVRGKEFYLGNFMMFFMYCGCTLQLHCPRLSLTRQIVKEESDSWQELRRAVDRFEAMSFTASPAPSSRDGTPTPLNGNNSLLQFATPPATPPRPSSTFKFDYATSARLRKSAQMCLKAARDAIIVESVISRVRMAPPFRKSPVSEFTVAIASQALLELYLTLRTASGLIYPGRPGFGLRGLGFEEVEATQVGERFGGLDVRQTWSGSVLERTEDGVLLDEEACEVMIQEIVTLMEMGVAFVKPLLMAARSAAQKNKGGYEIHPELLMMMQDTVTLHHFRSQQRASTPSSSGPLFQMQKLLMTLGSMGSPRPPASSVTPMGQLMAAVAKGGGPDKLVEEMKVMVEKEEVLHLERIEKVLEVVRKAGVPLVSSVNGEPVSIGRGMMESLF
ncbi:hypothetical protein HDU97_005662 [Phlyctochytrium planicorne]|nr:hypothetical protein HDU97_005662 [Phlyctochytrium planicorne]